MPVDVQTKKSQSPSKELEQVFLDHYDLVYRAAFRITGNSTDAEDALQTLFMRLIRRESTPDLKGGWPPYLHRAAINVALDIVRKRGRSVSITEMEPWIKDSRPDPYREHKSTELGAKLRGALSELNPRVAEVFALRHIEGYSNRDIAKMLGTSTGSIAVTLFRARGSLRKSLRSFVGGQ